MISRAARGIATLAPEGHVGHYVRLRRYRVAAADVDRLLRRVDASFVDRVAAVDGFLGYRLIDCGSGELLSSSLFRDGTSAAALDELAARFLAEEVGDIRVDRTDIVGGGPVVVSRVTDALLGRVDI